MQPAPYLTDVIAQADALVDALDVVQHLAATAGDDRLREVARDLVARLQVSLAIVDPDWRTRRLLAQAAAEWVDQHGEAQPWASSNPFTQLAERAYAESIGGA